MGWEGPPFQLEPLASLCGLRLREVPALGDRSREGAWTGEEILLRADLRGGRRRYTWAHEIAHSLVPEGPGDLDGITPAMRKRAHGDLELLCQIGASELLMPADSFRSHIGSKPLTCAHVTTRLAERFEVSSEAAGRRAVHFSEEPVTMLTAVEANRYDRPSYLPPLVTPRVAVRGDDLQVTTWCRGPRSPWSCSVAHGEPVPRQSCIRRSFFKAKRDHRAYATYAAIETWATYPELATFEVEAAPVPPYGAPYAVIAILRPSESALDS
jgi:hypothetical protein